MKKSEILFKSFQVILSRYEAIYCPEDNEYRVYCNICDKLCIERYYKNHLKSQTHTNDSTQLNNRLL